MPETSKSGFNHLNLLKYETPDCTDPKCFGTCDFMRFTKDTAVFQCQVCNKDVELP